ncbi:septal ring lytic transglycosylase RlpA family protein [Desulfobacula phenolica]|uniref:Probable endolytic peptidoglycan transglycosylase RlpA n=1 Tax=Desulfobacula phenolica TaxID=90732 RepID=A0A1H2INA1_9BACT|nr:septal ring lytic transglycosylase RlpA family protein [Desulfobacula phenolica]SDU45501.1 rare lipoprotein A [Desulfobacula phenolica]
MKLRSQIQILILFLFVISGCSTHLDTTYDPVHIPSSKSTIPKKNPATQKPYKINGVKYTPLASATGFVQTGLASWYGKKFHGRKTANGEIYDMYAMTAAHKTLPLGTWVSVHNLENNKKIVVRINDRGPFVYGRIIDLSYTGAKKLGVLGPGTAKVKVTALGRATSYSEKTKNPIAFTAVDYWKGNFTVQVGAFQVKANADNYRYKLSRNYQNAHIKPFEDYRGTFYRVRIGRFTNLKDAERFSDKLMEQDFSQAFAVAE